MIDPEIELVVCGSSGPSMPTFGDWEKRVLEHTKEHVDLISTHSYYEQEPSDLASFMASAMEMDRFIRTVTTIADRVGAKTKSRKRIDIFVGTSSVDLVEAGSFFVVPDPSGRPPHKVFDGTVKVSLT